MKYFIIFCLLIFLSVTLFLDIFKYFIGSDFRSGLAIVPIILMANLLLGVFYNLSVWYKLTDKTRFGAMIAFSGALITIILNVLLVPRYGYTGAAVAHLSCYFTMVIISFFLGRRYYRISYDLRNIMLYFIRLCIRNAVSHVGCVSQRTNKNTNTNTNNTPSAHKAFIYIFSKIQL
jgi:O-antigen/teichoic acid export membrane protein